jgi:hypothetical protein
MSAERSVKFTKDLLKTTGKASGIGLAAGLVGVAGITWRHHRELTHRSLELHPALQKFIDIEQSSIGVGDTTVWAAVHRIHHQMPDVSLFPFYRLSHAIKAATERGIEIPDSYEHLDPVAASFTREQVLEIGKHGDEVMRERLGNRYREPGFDSPAEIKEILNPTEPQYYYQNYSRHTGEYTQDDIARIYLTDPHSPALIPPTDGYLNGVKGVRKQNVKLYKNHADMFRARPDLKPQDLQTGKENDYKKPAIPVTAGFVIPSAAVLFARKKYDPEDVLIAAFAGSAANGVRIATELLGGKITNSAGHMGQASRSRIINALLKKEYHIVPNPDGTLSTNTIYSGALGKALSWLTFDEVGGQERHHEDPSKIAYTDKEGLRAWIEAPWGSFTSQLAYSKLSLVNPGQGFGLKEGESRPDVPHAGALKIQEIRVAQLALAA